MANPINSVSSRIQGMRPGNPVKPKSIGSFKYHLMFDDMESAWKLVYTFAPSDHPIIVTTNSRPNMYLVYDPTSTLDDKRVWTEWAYNEYASIQSGYYGTNYYLFGNGKVFKQLPQLID